MYFIPRLDIVGYRPHGSVAIYPFNFENSMAWAPTRSFQSSRIPGRGGSGCSRSSYFSSTFVGLVVVGNFWIVGFVLWTADRCTCICPIIVASCLSRNHCTNFTVRPGHEAYAPRSIAAIQVFFSGWPAALWYNSISSFFVSIR